MITASDPGQLARRFWSWWMAELAACLPERLRRMARPTPKLATLSVSRPDAPLRLVHGSRIEEGPTLTELTAHRRLLRRFRSGRISLVAILHADDVIIRHVNLPSAAERDLSAVIRYEIERLAPFDPSDMLIASDVVARESENRTISVRVRFVPRAMVEPVLERAAASGIAKPTLASAVERPGEGDLLRPLETFKTDRRPAERILMIGALSLCAALAAWAVLADRKLSEQARSAEAEAARFRQLALDAQAPSLDAETSVSPAARAAFELRQSRPLTLAILDALTAALDDDAVLERASFTMERIEIAGVADVATSLIADLEAAPEFYGPRFAAPVRRDAEMGRDAFRIEARVATDQAPAEEN